MDAEGSELLILKDFPFEARKEMTYGPTGSLGALARASEGALREGIMPPGSMAPHSFECLRLRFALILVPALAGKVETCCICWHRIYY